MEISVEEQLLLDDDALLGVGLAGDYSKSSVERLSIEELCEDDHLLDDSGVEENGLVSYGNSRLISTQIEPEKKVRVEAIGEVKVQRHSAVADFEDFSFSTKNHCRILPPNKTAKLAAPAFTQTSQWNKSPSGVVVKNSAAPSECALPPSLGKDENRMELRTECSGDGSPAGEEGAVVKAKEDTKSCRRIIKLTGGKKFRYVPSELTCKIPSLLSYKRRRPY